MLVTRRGWSKCVLPAWARKRRDDGAAIDDRPHGLQGQIVIPVAVRRRLGLKTGQPLAIRALTQGEILLSRRTRGMSGPVRCDRALGDGQFRFDVVKLAARRTAAPGVNPDFAHVGKMIRAGDDRLKACGLQRRGGAPR